MLSLPVDQRELVRTEAALRSNYNEENRTAEEKNVLNEVRTVMKTSSLISNLVTSHRGSE